MKSQRSFFLLPPLLLFCTFCAKADPLGTKVSTKCPCNSYCIEELDLVSVTEERDLSEQLSIMMGHLRAGLALFEIAEHDMGTPHLMHPIRETSEAQKNILRSYGFEESEFEFLAASVNEKSANSPGMAEVLSLISSMESLQSRLASDPFRNISKLLHLAIDEYDIAVEGNVISDISEYQDSYGFILEAKKQSALLKPAEASAVSSKIEELQALWVDGVLPPPQPTSASQVAKKVRDAIKELKEIQNASAKR